MTLITFERKKKGEGSGNNQIKAANWTPRHEAIVMDRISGRSLTDIADDYNLSEAMISTICNSKPAKALIARVSEQIHSEKYASLPQQRKEAIALAQQRMFDFLQDDALQYGAKIACAPMNVKIFEVLNSADKNLPAGGNSITQNIQLNILNNPEKRDALAEGLSRALEASQSIRSIDNVKELIPLSNTDAR